MNFSEIVNPAMESPVENGGIYGVVIGIVTNNQDEENMGRVKLRFPWLSDGDESFWARLATPMAGAERGMFFLPDVDDEVLVVFEHGDINRPYVIGALWNSVDAPPTANSDGENSIKMLKSRSGHTVTLDDTEGAEMITITDMTEANTISFDSANNLITVESSVDVAINAVDGNITMSAPNGNIVMECTELQATTSGAVTVESGAALDMISSAAMTIESGAGLDMSASAAMALAGATIDLN